MVLESHHITLMLSGHGGTVCGVKYHMELSVTPHAHVVGISLGSVEVPLGSVGALRPQRTNHPDLIHDAFSNPTTIISTACVVWSLSHSVNDIRMLYSNEFC